MINLFYYFILLSIFNLIYDLEHGIQLLLFWGRYLAIKNKTRTVGTSWENVEIVTVCWNSKSSNWVIKISGILKI